MQRERKWLENIEKTDRKKNIYCRSIPGPMLPLRGIDSKGRKAKSLDLERSGICLEDLCCSLWFTLQPHQSEP